MSYYQSRATIERREQSRLFREAKACLECNRPLGEAARSGKRERHPDCAQRHRTRVDGAAKLVKERKRTQVSVETMAESRSILARLVDHHHPCRSCGQLTVYTLCLECQEAR